MNNDKLDKAPGPDPEEAWESGRLLLGDFEVQRVLGQGGMGKVYLVRSRTTGMEFAVKRALVKDDHSRQSFLSELQTWIDLPEHPHIAACRFFRTIGDELAIFSEYVGGGTLADWIRDRRLATLDQILDVAIQFAWGLQALHERGLIHQDVKPGNVLMTPAGLVKVTDFGLARAQLRIGDEHLSPAAMGSASALVSFNGMTPAYCSPEQAAKKPLSRKTDIWSWGVSVLDIFHGQVSCRYGQAAGEALEAYFEVGETAGGLPRMPVEMTMLLGKCFLPKPEQRWNHMNEIADALVQMHQKICERAFDKKAPVVSTGTKRHKPLHAGRTFRSGSWRDPQEWLERALRAAGRNPTEAADIIEQRGSSLRGQLVADVALYHEARYIYERLLIVGQKNVETELADLCHEAAALHRAADDSSGSLGLYDRAIEIRERLVNVEDRRDSVSGLASLYLNKGATLESLGDTAAAVHLYDRAIEICERLVAGEHRLDVIDSLAKLYMNKAITLDKLGDVRAASDLYDRAISLRELLLEEKRPDLADDLATLYMNKAIALVVLGDARAAVNLYDRAIEIREKLVNAEGRQDLLDALARLYMNKAIALDKHGDAREAVDLYDRAIEIREKLVKVEGQHDLTEDLAKLYVNKANALTSLGDERGAASLYDQPIEIFERLVNVEGRRDLAHLLASVYLNKATTMKNLGDLHAAIDLCNQATRIYDHSVNIEGQHRLTGELAWAKTSRALALLQAGEPERGKQEANEAIAMLRTEFNRTGRADLRAMIDWTTNKLSKL